MFLFHVSNKCKYFFLARVCAPLIKGQLIISKYFPYSFRQFIMCSNRYGEDIIKYKVILYTHLLAYKS